MGPPVRRDHVRVLVAALALALLAPLATAHDLLPFAPVPYVPVTTTVQTDAQDSGDPCGAHNGTHTRDDYVDVEHDNQTVAYGSYDATCSDATAPPYESHSDSGSVSAGAPGAADGAQATLQWDQERYSTPDGNGTTCSTDAIVGATDAPLPCEPGISIPLAPPLRLPVLP